MRAVETIRFVDATDIQFHMVREERVENAPMDEALAIGVLIATKSHLEERHSADSDLITAINNFLHNASKTQ
jgi:hypothetical protein